MGSKGGAVIAALVEQPLPTRSWPGRAWGLWDGARWRGRLSIVSSLGLCAECGLPGLREWLCVDEARMPRSVVPSMRGVMPCVGGVGHAGLAIWASLRISGHWARLAWWQRGVQPTCMLGRLAFGVKGITTDVLLGWAWQAWLGGGGQ